MHGQRNINWNNWPWWRPCGGGLSGPGVSNSNCADRCTFSLSSTPYVARPVTRLEFMAANV